MSYDLNTDIGKVRLRIADTDTSNEIFSDAEIQYFLDEGLTVLGAAILALKSLATDRARLSKKIKREGYETEQHGISELLKVIEMLEAEIGAEALDMLGGDDVYREFRDDWSEDPTLEES